MMTTVAKVIHLDFGMISVTEKFRADLEETITKFINDLINTVSSKTFNAWKAVSNETLTGESMCEEISKYVYDTLGISLNVLNIKKQENFAANEMVFALKVDVSQNQADNYDKKTGQQLLDLLDEVQNMRRPETPEKKPRVIAQQTSSYAACASSAMCSSVSASFDAVVYGQDDDDMTSAFDIKVFK